MSTATIPVETYTVRIARNSSVPFARITLAGPVLSHGIQNRATLYFFPTYSSFNGWATNVGGLNFNGIHVLAQIPYADFAQMYDLLRNEAPVQLSYTYGGSTTTTKPVSLVALETGNEPPGEGPEDEDSVEHAIHALVALTASPSKG